jgi:hypothetical protein
MLTVPAIFLFLAATGIPIEFRPLGEAKLDFSVDDESGGRAVLDSSGHELLGKFHKEPKRIAGVMGNAPVFDGTNYIDFGHSTALRLARSMTISAWIDSNSYPVDDAAMFRGSIAIVGTSWTQRSKEDLARSVSS